MGATCATWHLEDVYACRRRVSINAARYWRTGSACAERQMGRHSVKLARDRTNVLSEPGQADRGGMSGTARRRNQDVIFPMADCVQRPSSMIVNRQRPSIEHLGAGCAHRRHPEHVVGRAHCFRLPHRSAGCGATCAFSQSGRRKWQRDDGAQSCATHTNMKRVMADDRCVAKARWKSLSDLFV